MPRNPSLNQSVTLICSACGRSFEKPRSAVQTHNLVACPHCATLQAGRLARDPAPPPLAGTVRPSYRKGP